MVDGGQILLDDYGWLTYREQKAAEDVFFGGYGVPVLEDALRDKDVEVVFRAERLLLRLNRQVP